MIYTILGWAAVGLGAIGIILPVLPTTPFMILAAFLFAKGSPRARAWLLRHRAFGPHILHWENQDAISRPAKRMAVTVMALAVIVSFYFGVPGWVLIVQVVCMGSAAIFICTRPDPNA